MTDAPRIARKSFDPRATGPLEGVRVIDMSRLVAGNIVTHALADFGADVIKVERPGAGDDLRNWRVRGHSVFWKTYARNKRSIALDIKDAKGRAILERLIRQAHVLVENFVPGTMEKMGLGPDALLAMNRKLVVVRVSGWGQTGPWKDKPGFGTLVEAMSGFAHMNGFPDKPPAVPPLALADMIAGQTGAFAVMTALREVEVKGGDGQVIDLSLFEPIFAAVASEAGVASIEGKGAMRAGNTASHTAPRNLYACSDGKYVALSGSMQAMAERILRTIGRPELVNDPRFATNDARVRHRDELDAIIAGFIGARTQEQNLALFEAAGVTVGPVCAMEDLLVHPYPLGREAIVAADDVDLGHLPMHNVVPRLSRTPGTFRRPAPTVGADTEEVLADLERWEKSAGG
ncbi:MAG: CoA transferase [Alphaproteobacteria bacterium]|nr:CoA transferase [Alphaproteobacteria bacterium]